MYTPLCVTAVMVTAFMLATTAAHAANNVKKMSTATDSVKANVEAAQYGAKKPSNSFYVLKVAVATQPAE